MAEPTKDDIEALVGPATPHFAMQIRARVRALIRELPEDHPVRRYGDEQIARFTWTSGVSRDPVISFTLKADKEAPLTMVWTDNKGGVYRQSVPIAFTAA